MKIAWREEALDDLERLRACISRDDPAAAVGTVVRILDAVELLIDQTGLGRPGRVAGTRELIVDGTPCRVAYRVRDSVIEVLRVLHGGRRWPARSP